MAPSDKVSKLIPYYDNSDGSTTPLDNLDTIFRLGSAKHLGESAEGAWTIRITDHYTQDAEPSNPGPSPPTATAPAPLRPR